MEVSDKGSDLSSLETVKRVSDKDEFELLLEKGQEESV